MPLFAWAECKLSMNVGVFICLFTNGVHACTKEKNIQEDRDIGLKEQKK